MKNFTKLIIHSNSTIYAALSMIEANSRGFLIVLDDSESVIGTLTDGDLRRQLLSGLDLSDTIEVGSNFNVLSEKDDFNLVCSLFRSNRINFLPIVDENSKLKNVITKKQFHAMLLHDLGWDSNNDFNNFSENELEFDIHNRPWGFYKSTLLSDFVQSKILTIFPSEQLSLQKHKLREEHWVVVKGSGKAVIDESRIELYPGKYIFVPKGCKHQIINDSKANIIISEVQLGSYFGEDDIFRFSDKYGRDLADD